MAATPVVEQAEAQSHLFGPTHRAEAAVDGSLHSFLRLHVTSRIANLPYISIATLTAARELVKQ